MPWKVGDRSAITVRLFGGLGNQLFQFAAGKAAAIREDCPLHLDTSQFSQTAGIGTQRYFELDSLRINAEWVSIPKPLRLATRAVRHRNRRIAAVAQGVSGVFSERSFSYDDRIQSVRVGTTLIGYFQSPMYFENASRQLEQELRLLDPSTWYAELAQEIRTTPKSVAIHIRRGDYLEPTNADRHGVLPQSYYRQALDVLQDNGRLGTLFLFTDEKDLEVIKSMRWPITPIIIQPPGSVRPAESLLAMSNASSLVIANSSFSWWAAWLARLREGSTVIAPHPWFRGESLQADTLIPEDWLSLPSGH